MPTGLGIFIFLRKSIAGLKSIDIITAKGMTSMKSDVKNSLDKKKKENDQLGQLSQQVQQLDQQLKQATQTADTLQKEVQKLNEQKMKLEQDKLNFEKEIGWYKAKDDTKFKQIDADLENKRVAFEGLQLLDANPNNDEIKNK